MFSSVLQATGFDVNENVRRDVWGRVQRITMKMNSSKQFEDRNV